MITNQVDINKFSFAEAMSNSNGKTSGSKFAGLIGIIVGAIGFLGGLIGSFYKLPDAVAIAGLSSALITGSYVLFGYSKSQATKDTTNTIVEDN